MSTKQIPPRIAYKYAEVAQMIGVHKDTVRNWANDGTIRTVAIGGTRLVPASELERLVGAA